jgi:hypothetical protein
MIAEHALDEALKTFADALARAHDGFERERFLRNVYGPFVEIEPK